MVGGGRHRLDNAAGPWDEREEVGSTVTRVGLPGSLESHLQAVAFWGVA